MCEADGNALEREGLPLTVERPPTAALDSSSPYSVDEAVLVRPDRFVAARWPTADRPDLAALLGRT